MAVISMKQLLEAGVHFGHQTRRWNPKMKNTSSLREMVSISLTYKNSEKVEEAYNFIKQVSEDGGRVLFVGTKNKHKSQLKSSRTSDNSTLTKDG